MLCIFFLSFLQVINSLQGPAKKTKKLCDAHEGYPVNFMRGFLSSSVFLGGVGEGGIVIAIINICRHHFPALPT